MTSVVENGADVCQEYPSVIYMTLCDCTAQDYAKTMENLKALFYVKCTYKMLKYLGRIII